ncbi:hypothetical protein Salat_0624500 [Sesamum alatum]|uniref:Uncharacterized protein n=1 Tax=Sesamum alatum TaxID=300844 RepID=A0AAE1YR46_9LAMI|nr:hypothetical protein Salat_0624500 [Sesamum alatum]
MGSVRFVGEDETQPSATNKKKNKLPRKLLDDCGAVNHAPVPRRLRSAIKKRGRESVTPPLPISRKQLHTSNGVEILRVDGVKKSRLNMKQVHITKDEEEVAETLYSLADMFSDIAKTNKPILDGEPSEIKSSTIVEAGSSMTTAKDAEIPTQQEESREINTRVTLESACHSSVSVNPTKEVVKYQSLDDAQQPELPFSEQSATPIASGIPSHSSLGPRPKMSTFDMIQSCERTTAQKQVATSGIQYGNHHCPKEDKYKGLLLQPSLSSTGVVGSNTQGSSPLSLPNIFPAWFENTNCATQPIVNENSITADKIHYHQVVLEPKKSRKRCSTHMYIAHLVKVLQKPERNIGLLQKPSHITTTGGLEKGSHASIDNQKMAINGRHGDLPFNGFIHSASEGSSDIGIAGRSNKRLLQYQQHPNKTSVLCSSWKRGSDFLSLDAGGSDTNGGVNRAGCSREALNQFNVSYQQPQNHSTMLFSLSQNGYSSTFHDRTSTAAAPKVQIPPYLSNTFGGTVTAPLGQQLESQQQKWTSQLQAQCSPSGVGRPHLLPEWQNGGRNSPSLLNYAQALFPHLHSVMGSKYQHFSPPQQQHSPVNSTLTLSNVERHHHRLNSAYERNGSALCSENASQMQLLCNQQL